MRTVDDEMARIGMQVLRRSQQHDNLRLLVLARGSLVRRDDGRYGCHVGNATFINGLASAGAHTVLCGHVGGTACGSSAAAIAPEVEVRILGRVSGWRYISLIGLWKLVRCIRTADYLYLFTGTFAVFVCLVNRFLLRKPYAVYEQPWTDDDYLAAYFQFRSRGAILRRLYPPIMKVLRRWMIRGASHVYVHGGKLSEECRARGCANVLDVVPLTPIKPDDFWQRPNRAEGQPLRIAYVGGVGPVKGIEVLIEALHFLRQRGVVFEFRSATKRPLSPGQRERLKTLNLGFRLQTHAALDWNPDLRTLLRESDAMVVSSFSEGFPRVIYEAGSQSMALVTTPVGGIPWALSDGHDALFVPAGDAKALADALERLAKEPRLVQELGKNLHDTVWRLLFQQRAFDSHSEQVVHFARESVYGEQANL